jgi:hypothetical protein
MGKNILRVSLILLLISVMSPMGIPRVHADTPITISLDPIYYEAALSHSFSINVTISNVGNETVGLGAIEFRLTYNTTLLDAVTTHLTPISEDYLDNYVGLVTPYDDQAPINDTLGKIRWGAIVKDIYDPFVGSGALLTIDFNATAEGSCALHLYDTLLAWIEKVTSPTFPDTGEYVLDTDYSVEDGSITVIPEFPVHDVAVTDISASSYEVDINTQLIVTINVTVANEGDFPETFDVTVRYDTTDIDTENVTDLAAGDSTTVDFEWSVTGVPLGIPYTIEAEAILAGDDDPTNNKMTSEWTITIVPEFPTSIVTPLLLIATLAATFLGKMVWSRKRKDAPTAESYSSTHL